MDPLVHLRDTPMNRAVRWGAAQWLIEQKQEASRKAARTVKGGGGGE